MNNPPVWSVELFRDYCSKISKYADKHGLPMPVTEKALIPICDLGKEYGRGAYGIVWPTEKEGVVFKITTDQSEAHFVKTAIDLREDKGIDEPGVVKYYDIVAIPKKQLNRNIFMLWREEASSTGIDYSFVGSSKFADLLHTFKEYAQDIWRTTNSRFKELKNPDNYWKWLDKNLKDKGSWISRDLELMREISLEIYRNSLGKHVGSALHDYMHEGLIIADAHAGNVGEVFRGDKPGVYVITDPGQVAVLRRELSSPEIEVIR